MTMKEGTDGSSPRKESFRDAIKRISQKKNRDIDVLSLFIYIEHTLNQYEISPDCCPINEILNHSISTGLLTIQNGTAISVPIGWIRNECRKYIRSVRYRLERELPIDDVPRNILDQLTLLKMQAGGIQEDYQLAKLAFEALSPMFQQVIDLLVIQELNSSQAEAFLDAAGTPCSAAAIRKRKERALKQFEENYMRLKERAR